MSKRGVYKSKRPRYLRFMSKGKSRISLREAADKLREAGIRVPLPSIQKNVTVDKDLWERVNAARVSRNMRIRECVAEALEMWLAHKGEGPEKN